MKKTVLSLTVALLLILPSLLPFVPAPMEEPVRPLATSSAPEPPVPSVSPLEIEGTLERSRREPTPSPTPTVSPTPSPTPPRSVAESPQPKIAASNVDLLARLILAEAGYTDEAQMRGVAQVVKNRMKHYKLSLKEAVYQKLGDTYVFSPARKLSSMKSTELSRKIARDILGGKVYSKVEDSLFFITTEAYERKTGWHWRSSHGAKPTTRKVCVIGKTVFLALI